MRRDATGGYETSVAGRESVRALVPIDSANFVRQAVGCAMRTLRFQTLRSILLRSTVKLSLAGRRAAPNSKNMCRKTGFLQH